MRLMRTSGKGMHRSGAAGCGKLHLSATQPRRGREPDHCRGALRGIVQVLPLLIWGP